MNDQNFKISGYYSINKIIKNKIIIVLMNDQTFRISGYYTIKK